jgi:hypothetical protein
MGVVPGSREEWEDIEPGDPEMRSGDESAEELGDLMKQQQNHIEDMFEKGADREDIEAAEGNLEDLEREYDEKVGSEDAPEGEIDFDDDDKVEKTVDDMVAKAATEHDFNSAAAKQLEGEIMGPWDFKTWEEYDEHISDKAAKLAAHLDRGSTKRAGRTGDELNQETLTIDGKQFRRMSEGVEQKPKYEFSEFYKRFKR